jgi:hypothetical protein
MFNVGSAVCRHGIAVKAANILKTGERYGYAHLLYTATLLPKKPSTLYIDVMCKWDKWCNKALELLDKYDENVDVHVDAEGMPFMSTGYEDMAYKS